jgi:hypothetical protein
MCTEIFNLWVIAEIILYMHDGAQVHFSRAVRDVLNNTCHDRWIGRGGPTAWPKRSPDLNPLDFYLKPLCTQLLLTTKKHVTIALWLPVSLSATTPALWTDAAVHDMTWRGVHWIWWRTFWALITNALFQLLGWCISSCGFCLRQLCPNKNCMVAMCNNHVIAFVFLYQTYLDFSDFN